MKRLFLAVFVLLFASKVMAANFQYSIYGFSYSAIKLASGGFIAGNPNNYVALLNGANAFVVAPVIYTGTGSPTVQNVGAQVNTYLSRCPVYCDIASLATNLGMHSAAYNTLTSDLTKYNTTYPNTYNCLLLNNSFLQLLTNSPVSVSYVYVMVWQANGKSNFLCFGCDSNNQPIQQTVFTDSNAGAFLI